MLTGEYKCSLDVKGRISFPAKFRDEIGTRFLVARWLDNCLMALPEQQFADMVTQYTQKQPIKARDIRRFLYSGATIVEPDKQGRILLPQSLREYAALEKDAVVIGVGDRAEIWAADKWQQLNTSFDSAQIAAVLEEMELL